MTVSSNPLLALGGGQILVTQGFGGTTHAVGTSAQYSLDIAATKGAKVYAEGKGRVVALRESVIDGGPASTSANDPSNGSGNLGNYITVLYDNGVYVTYANLGLNSVLPTVGSVVNAGTVLGAVGNTGLRSSTHLHVQYGTTLNGGIASATGVPPVVIDTAAGVSLPGIVSSTTYDLHLNKTLAANQHNLTLVGTASINGYGDSFANTISGNSGNNILDGRTGADTMAGGLGNDTYYVDNSGDKVVELALQGIDKVVASIDYALGTEVENLQLTRSGRIGTGNAHNNEIVGNTHLKNVLSGLGGNDTLHGGRFDDVLDGGTGADAMHGGHGSDTYLVDNIADRVFETTSTGADSGGSNDKVVSTINYTLGANVEHLDLTGTALVGQGNALGNTINGNAYNNSLFGLDGNDTLYGFGGDDKLYGGNGNDRLFGGDGNDLIVGGNGGSDDLFGGSGRDVFDFNDVRDSLLGTLNYDTIGDFERGLDKIDLRDIDANSRLSGDQLFRFIGNNQFSGQSGELRSTNYGLVEVDINGDKTADFSFQSKVVLLESDFWL